ncbi:MAG: DUF1499 domain-containing protein, partial [Acidobacteriota bacterium]|nr:DUF1499 domain-containing protein [Acidobacteriota bacterium]
SLGILSPLIGFLLVGLGLVPATLLTLVLALVALYLTRAPGGVKGRRHALQALGIGAVLAVVGFVAARGGRNVPPIHDITTNLDDPPQFVAALTHPDNASRDLTYPHGGSDVPQLQREGYGDLEPIHLDGSAETSFAAAVAAANELGWEVVDEDPATGRIEATETTTIFSFVDDVVIRVRADGPGSVVDLRSTSRVGQSDLGANAARIRAFRDKITGD